MQTGRKCGIIKKTHKLLGGIVLKKEIYKILPLNYKLYVLFAPRGMDIFNHIVSLIEKPISKKLIPRFSFVPDNEYSEVLEEYYQKHLEFEKLTLEEWADDIIHERKYTHFENFLFSDENIPDKYKPFVSNGNYLCEKFPVPLSMKKEFIIFLFWYVKKNKHYIKKPEDPWFYKTDNSKEKYFKLTEKEMKQMYEEFKKKYTERS